MWYYDHIPLRQGWRQLLISLPADTNHFQCTCLSVPVTHWLSDKGKEERIRNLGPCMWVTCCNLLTGLTTVYIFRSDGPCYRLVYTWWLLSPPDCATKQVLFVAAFGRLGNLKFSNYTNTRHKRRSTTLFSLQLALTLTNGTTPTPTHQCCRLGGHSIQYRYSFCMHVFLRYR